MTTKSISIIIPTKDRTEILRKTLNFLCAAIANLDYEVIVINDSKTQNIYLEDGFPNNLIVINNPKSGVASARNLGAKMAKNEWLLFLDDDMLIFKENIGSYLKYTNILNKICVNIEWIYPPEITNKITKTSFGRFLIKYGFTTMRGWSNYPDWSEKSSIRVTSMSSPNLFINKNHFFETGGYDENFPFAGFEDYAFLKRLESHNFTMYIDTTSLMYHNEADRLKPKEWFERKVRGGVTRRIAFEQGFGDMEIKKSYSKKIIYFFSPALEYFFKCILVFSSASQKMDFISFKCYKMQLGISIYKGYTKRI